MCYCHYTIVSLQEAELSQVEVGALHILESIMYTVVLHFALL